MHLKQLVILLISLMLLSSFSAIKKVDYVDNTILLTSENLFVAGQTVRLEFSSTNTSKPTLYCSNSYGSTLISPILKKGILEYTIPSIISQKKGLVTWKLITRTSTLSGEFKITAIQKVNSLETYIGPPSIEAGETDYSMVVIIPTDSLDNPLAENTLVKVKSQFLSTEKSEDIYTKNLIAHKNLSTQKKSGRMLVSSECLSLNSKEFTVNIMPSIPYNFTIFAKRSHDYADGNQITSFSTSIIKDKLDNIVSDGTFVSFLITNKKGHILKTSGSTINGIATSKMIHPDYEEEWQVKAYVNGMAESDLLTLKYKTVIKDFNVILTNNNRKITIGPLQSFMKQMIPDGLKVKLSVYKNGVLLKDLTKSSINGYVEFNLKAGIFEKGDYTFMIKTAGLEKTFDNKELW